MKTLHTLIGISTLLFTVATASASEVIGTLSTGLGNSTVSGVVISSPSASIPGGSYVGTQSVTLSSSGSLSIRYTLDGTSPTCSTGNVYASAISVSSSLTIKAISCYVNSGSSTVASYAYTISAPVATGGGGGGGGGGFIYSPIATATTTATTTRTTGGTQGTQVATGTTQTVGQVLGATTFNFKVNLRLGAKGVDVTELQKVLITGGYLKATATGYFGTLTKQALIKWQVKNKLPPTGYFGPMSRAVLNGN